MATLCNVHTRFLLFLWSLKVIHRPVFWFPGQVDVVVYQLSWISEKTPTCKDLVWWRVTPQRTSKSIPVHTYRPAEMLLLICISHIVYQTRPSLEEETPKVVISAVFFQVGLQAHDVDDADNEVGGPFGNVCQKSKSFFLARWAFLLLFRKTAVCLTALFSGCFIWDLTVFKMLEFALLEHSDVHRQ